MSIGMKDIAVPMKTILIVEIIGVTLFFENDEKRKQRQATEIITKFENIKLRKNLHIISSSPSNNIPS
tara:strand:+ start:312 stop:515 length:204 start_codon:yes stop_codon:yes gene_type:complete